MSRNGVKSWQARQAWGAIKEAAAAHGDFVTGIAQLALSAWGKADAGTKLSHDRSHREAFVASLVGAAAVDLTIDKLAEEGTLSTPEADYMRDLNAESALRDLGQFQKSAGALRAAAELIAKNPTAVGAVAGLVASAGFGAYADEENRLRGAIRYGVPGALMGGMAGYGLVQHREEVARRLKEEAELAERAAREAERHALEVKEKLRRMRGF